MSLTQDSTCEQYVHRIADFLKQGTPFEEVSSTISSVMNEPTQLNIPIKKVKKEKKYVNLHNQIPIEQLDTIERLPTGRVRYGPVVVNPRKKPSKTIFTGRRSKNEVLYGEEEEKRRSRRERNRAAAARCREKREKCKQSLEQQIQEQEKRYQDQIREIEALRQRKEKLEFVLHQMFINFCETVPDLSENVDLNTSAPALLPQTLELVAQNEDEFENLLINSSNDNHLINIPLDNCQEPITITSSSLNRMIDECAPLVDTTNNILYNSAYGLPTCAQQYSSSSSNEDDSMASIQRNSYVY